MLTKSKKYITLKFRHKKTDQLLKKYIDMLLVLYKINNKE